MLKIVCGLRIYVLHLLIFYWECSSWYLPIKHFICHSIGKVNSVIHNTAMSNMMLTFTIHFIQWQRVLSVFLCGFCNKLCPEKLSWHVMNHPGLSYMESRPQSYGICNTIQWSFDIWCIPRIMHLCILLPSAPTGIVGRQSVQPAVCLSVHMSVPNNGTTLTLQGFKLSA